MSSEKSCDLHESTGIISMSESSSIMLKKNEFGNYEHLETHLVFSKENKTVIGKQNPDGSISPLTNLDINICRQLKVSISTSEILSDEELNDSGNILHKEIYGLSDAEIEYKEMLIELFVTKWSKKFEGKTEMTTYGLSNCKIKNIHGLEFYGYEIIYNPKVKEYILEFYIGKSIDGITSPNDELFILQTGGPSLKLSFSTILDYINKYIFCKHCGVIRQFDSYSEEHDRCDNCLINELLMLNRKHSEYCTICMENTKNYYTLRCGHKFHRACLSDLKVKACPNCRKWINEEDSEEDSN
ncbi:MAG: RING finger domain-containing protein [Candidatus Colwellbacteria bacterium]|nr:RING finger domain-containing protein [Candidatus Colwellbacteria bacterium]